MSRRAFTTRGFRELDKALTNDMTKTMARNVLRRAGTKALKPVEELAKRLAPKDEGDLAERITTKVVRAKRVSRTRFAASKGVEVATGPTGRPEGGGNAGWQEFGTVDRPAQPYMRPAADQQGGIHTVDRLGIELARDVDKTAKRIARKLARKK